MLTWLCLNSQKPATQQILLSIIAALKLLFWTWYQSEKVTKPDKNILYNVVWHYIYFFIIVLIKIKIKSLMICVG